MHIFKLHQSDSPTRSESRKKGRLPPIFWGFAVFIAILYLGSEVIEWTN